MESESDFYSAVTGSIAAPSGRAKHDKNFKL